MKISQIPEKEFNINKQTHPHLADVLEMYIADDKYIIYISEPNNQVHLRVKRIDNLRIEENWFDILQEIKNNIFGKDRIAIMIFPKQEDLINGSHTYHLWLIENNMPISKYVPNLKDLYQYAL